MNREEGKRENFKRKEVRKKRKTKRKEEAVLAEEGALTLH